MFIGVWFWDYIRWKRETGWFDIYDFGEIDELRFGIFIEDLSMVASFRLLKSLMILSNQFYLVINFWLDISSKIYLKSQILKSSQVSYSISTCIAYRPYSFK